MQRMAHIIGTLCQQIHPEAQNEIEAVDIQRSNTYKHINLKLDNKIAAADDIELYYLLGSAYDSLVEEEAFRRAKENG